MQCNVRVSLLQSGMADLAAGAGMAGAGSRDSLDNRRQCSTDSLDRFGTNTTNSHTSHTKPPNLSESPFYSLRYLVLFIVAQCSACAVARTAWRWL